MDKATHLNVATNAKVPYPEPWEKSRGATKTLPMIMGAHPMPSGRERISLF